MEVAGCKKRLRRRGKPLVAEPYIEEDDEPNDQYRCKVKREHPFRSTSNDVSQSGDRCNVAARHLLPLKEKHYYLTTYSKIWFVIKGLPVFMLLCLFHKYNKCNKFVSSSLSICRRTSSNLS